MKKYPLILFFLPVFALSAEPADWGHILNISIVGYMLVLFALFVIYLFMTLLSRGIAEFYQRREKNRKKIEGGNAVLVRDSRGETPSLETVAAIILAVQKTAELQREEEKAIMTIGKVVRPYSPWSSKLYGMRNQPWQTMKRG